MKNWIVTSLIGGIDISLGNKSCYHQYFVMFVNNFPIFKHINWNTIFTELSRTVIYSLNFLKVNQLHALNITAIKVDSSL